MFEIKENEALDQRVLSSIDRRSIQVFGAVIVLRCMLKNLGRVRLSPLLWRAPRLPHPDKDDVVKRDEA